MDCELSPLDFNKNISEYFNKQSHLNISRATMTQKKTAKNHANKAAYLSEGLGVVIDTHGLDFHLLCLGPVASVISKKQYPNMPPVGSPRRCAR